MYSNYAGVKFSFRERVGHGIHHTIRTIEHGFDLRWHPLPFMHLYCDSYGGISTSWSARKDTNSGAITDGGWTLHTKMQDS